MEISKRTTVETPINIDGKCSKNPLTAVLSPKQPSLTVDIPPNERIIFGSYARLLHHPRRWLASIVVFPAVTSNVRCADRRCGSAGWRGKRGDQNPKH